MKVKSIEPGALPYYVCKYVMALFIPYFFIDLIVYFLLFSFSFFPLILGREAAKV